MGEARRRRAQGLRPRAPKLDLAGQRAVAVALTLYPDAPPDFIDVARRMFAFEWATAQEILSEEGRSPAGALAVAGNAQAWAAHLAADEIVHAPETVGCREGCAWCCFLPVTVTPSEVLLLAAWILREYSPERLTALQERLRAAAPVAEQPIATRRLLPCRSWRTTAVAPTRPGRGRAWATPRLTRRRAGSSSRATATVASRSGRTNSSG